MQIQVQDELGSGENEPVIFVRTVSVSISHDPAVTQVSTTDDQIVAQTGKFLGINFELECGEGFYGPDCGVLCTSRDDELGHFSCDSSGNSKCLDGFTDTTTNCTQCLLSQGCCKRARVIILLSDSLLMYGFYVCLGGNVAIWF